MSQWLVENWLALLALLVAVAAAVPAYIAIAHTKRQLALSQEVHDVTWDWDWIDSGVIRVTNESDRHTARDVVARFSVDDEKVAAKATEVGPGEFVDLTFPEAAEEHKKHLRRSNRAKGQAPSPLDAILRLPQPVGLGFYVGWRIDWLTPLGSARSEEDAARTQLTGPDDDE